MYKHSKRVGYCFTVENGEATITLIKPKCYDLSNNGEYIVIYEDAYGSVDLRMLKLDEIASDYSIDVRDLEDVV